MGDKMLGRVTRTTIRPRTTLPEQEYVEDFMKANNFRPDSCRSAAYDGHPHLEALKKTGGKTDGDSLLAAMRA